MNDVTKFYNQCQCNNLFRNLQIYMKKQLIFYKKQVKYYKKNDLTYC